MRIYLKIFIVLLSALTCDIVNGQEGSCLFKDMCVGMSKKEANKEYRANKNKYTNIDIGYGWVYRTDIQNLKFDSENKLVGIYFFLQNTKLSGVGYQNTKNALDMTRQFFEMLEYTVFHEDEYWNLPLNFSAVYGMVMVDKNKSKIVHIFPTHATGNINSHAPGLILYDYVAFMEEYDERQKVIQEKQQKTGF